MDIFDQVKHPIIVMSFGKISCSSSSWSLFHIFTSLLLARQTLSLRRNQTLKSRISIQIRMVLFKLVYLQVFLNNIPVFNLKHMNFDLRIVKFRWQNIKMISWIFWNPFRFNLGQRLNLIISGTLIVTIS